MESAMQKNYYLMRDLTDNVVHVFTRKEKAERIIKHLQEENPKTPSFQKQLLQEL